MDEEKGQTVPDIYLAPADRQAIVFDEMRNSATEGRSGGSGGRDGSVGGAALTRYQSKGIMASTLM